MLFKDKLIFYPDKKLRQLSQLIDTKTQGQQIMQLSRTLCNVMIREKGLGLSAIQIGVPWQMFVMYPDVECKESPICLINARIIEQSNDREVISEGCLSIPGIAVQLQRPQYVLVEYEDCQGQIQLREFVDLIAVCVQHEMDHCRGILIVDYLTKQDQNAVENYYRQNADQLCTDKLIKPSQIMTFVGNMK